MAAAQQSSTSTFDNQCLKNGKKLYLNADKADIHFTFGAGGKKAKRIPAHKAILAADSDVFDAMFYGDSKVSSDVHVPDSTEAAFMEFLQYFYLSKVNLTQENIVGVLHLGDKYDVKQCINDCVQFLMRKLDDENVCECLDLAIKYDEKQLIELCEKRILLDTEAVLDSPGFLTCTKKVLGFILKMDVLSGSEIMVFEACMAWVKAKIGRAELSMKLVETHLGDFYHKIRFASMTMEQLCTLQAKYDSVLARDFITITKMIVQPDFVPPKFKKDKRTANWNADAIVECDRVIETEASDSCPLGEHEETTFTVNKPLIFGSFSCAKIFLIYDGSVLELPVDVEVSEASDSSGNESKVLSTTNVKLESNGTDVLLPHPILVRPGFFYTIRMGPFPQQHIYHCKSLKRVVEPEADTNIEFCNYYMYTLVSMLKFNKI